MHSSNLKTSFSWMIQLAVHLPTSANNAVHVNSRQRAVERGVCALFDAVTSCNAGNLATDQHHRNDRPQN